MKKNLQMTKSIKSLVLALIMVFFGLSSVNSQDMGPTNYCIPNNSMVTANTQIFGTDLALVLQ